MLKYHRDTIKLISKKYTRVVPNAHHAYGKATIINYFRFIGKVATQ